MTTQYITLFILGSLRNSLKMFGLQFPTVTICNQNLWRRSVIKFYSDNKGLGGIKDMLQEIYGFGPFPPPVQK